MKVFVQGCNLGCGFFEHTIFTLGYTNATDTEHFGSDFFASLHVAKLIPLNSSVSLIFVFYELSLVSSRIYGTSCATSTAVLQKKSG
jgi:hypothetical protein